MSDEHLERIEAKLDRVISTQTEHGLTLGQHTATLEDHSQRLELLDRRLSGVEVALETTVPQSIKQLADEGMTCILVTHEMRFAREVADHIYFTDRGVIVEHGPPEEFFTGAKDPRTREFLGQVL